MTTQDLSIEEVLWQGFGLRAFRTGQREVIESVLASRDALVVMPTGSGKSLCYQLPAMALPGLTLVVSPLIALMKDQVDSLQARGLPAACINSTVDFSLQRQHIRDARDGKLKLLFVAPERFRVDAFMRALEPIEVSLLAIDEAHCISQWGHDFRPDYMRLGDVREALGDPPVVALTATATPFVRDDILTSLRLRDPDVMVFGFERPNLHFEICATRSNDEKIAAIVAITRAASGCGIVYCATRKQVEDVGPKLAASGLRVGLYHGGLSDNDRNLVQDAFMKDEVDCLVATNAFGMGVDKSDLRHVVHYNMPGSLEAYYQEAGRAGRDGEPARCVLLYNYADTGIHDFFIKASHPSPALISDLFRVLRRQGVGQTVPWSADELRPRLSERAHPMAIDSALRVLRVAGYLEQGREGGWTLLKDAPRGGLDVDFDLLERMEALERERLKRVVFYATTERCRTVYVLNYFGSREISGEGCGHCDNCAIARGEISAARPLQFALTPVPKRRLPAREPVRTVVVKILSCVARLNGRGALDQISATLAGSRAQAITRARLHELPTYKLLSYLKRKEVDYLVEQVSVAGLIVLDRRRRASLSPDGLALMTSREAAMPGPLAALLHGLFRNAPDHGAPWRPR